MTKPIRCLTNRWSARVRDKVPSPNRRSRGAQLNRYAASDPSPTRYTLTGISQMRSFGRYAQISRNRTLVAQRGPDLAARLKFVFHRAKLSKPQTRESPLTVVATTRDKTAKNGDPNVPFLASFGLAHWLE